MGPNFCAGGRTKRRGNAAWSRSRRRAPCRRARATAGSHSACPGKVDTGFPIRTCATAKEVERIPFHSNGIRSRRRLRGFRPHRGITTGASGGRDDGRFSAAGRGRSDLRIDTARRADHALRAIELLAQWLARRVAQLWRIIVAVRPQSLRAGVAIGSGSGLRTGGPLRHRRRDHQHDNCRTAFRKGSHVRHSIIRSRLSLTTCRRAAGSRDIEVRQTRRSNHPAVIGSPRSSASRQISSGRRWQALFSLIRRRCV